MKVVCEACEAAIPARNLNLKDKIAKCDDCDNVFNFQAQLNAIAGQERREVGLPESIEVNSDHRGLIITRRWFSPAILFLTLFCVFWDGFMVVWFSIAISQQQWAMAAFGTVHGLVGVGLTYFVVAGYLNKTYIVADQRNHILFVLHKPIPWFGSAQIAMGDVDQLYVKETVHQRKRGVSYSYELRINTTDGRDVKLLSGLDESQQALFIEQEIEKYLGIEDQPVRGELPRA